jgi:hypothetical protein
VASCRTYWPRTKHESVPSSILEGGNSGALGALFEEDAFIRSSGEFVRSLHLKLIQKLRDDPEIGPYMPLIEGKAWSRWRKYIRLRDRATIHENVESDLVSAGLLGFAEARSKGRLPDAYIAALSAKRCEIGITPAAAAARTTEYAGSSDIDGAGSGRRNGYSSSSRSIALSKSRQK